MPETPSKVHMYDMVKIDRIVFEIVGGGGGVVVILLPPPPRIVSCLKYPGSDRVNSQSRSSGITDMNYITANGCIIY